MRSRLTYWLGTTGLLLCMGPVHALEAEQRPSSASPTPAAGPPRVSVVVVGAELATSFALRVQSWFSSGTRVSVDSAPNLRADLILSPKLPEVVEVWLDLRTQDVAHVYLVVAGSMGERCLVRDLELTHGLDELGQEGLAQVVYSAVLAVWEGRDQSPRGELERRLGVVPGMDGDAGSSSRTPRPLGPRPSRLGQGASQAHQESGPSKGAAVHGGYAANWRGQEGLAHGPELWGTIWERHGQTRLGGLVLARYLVPVQARADSVTLTLTGADLRIGVSAGRTVGEAIGVSAGAALGAVLVHYRPKVTGDVSGSLRAGSSEVELRPIASVFVSSATRVGSVEFVLVPRVDLQLTRTRYEVSRNGTRSLLFEPWMLQPGLALLMGWAGRSSQRSWISAPRRAPTRRDSRATAGPWTVPRWRALTRSRALTTSANPAATAARTRSDHGPDGRCGAWIWISPVRNPILACTSTSCAMLTVVPPFARQPCTARAKCKNPRIETNRGAAERLWDHSWAP